MARSSSGKLVLERKASFTPTASSSTAAPAAPSSAYTGRTYRVPGSTVGSTGAVVASVSTSSKTASDDEGAKSNDSQEPVVRVSLAERMQSYTRKASSSNVLTSALGEIADKADISMPSVGSESANAETLNLHSLSNQSTEQIDAELLARPHRLEEKDSNGRTPLLAACFGRKWDMAKFFVEKGADVTVKDRVRIRHFKGNPQLLVLI